MINLDNYPLLSFTILWLAIVFVAFALIEQVRLRQALSIRAKKLGIIERLTGLLGEGNAIYRMDRGAPIRVIGGSDQVNEERETKLREYSQSLTEWSSRVRVRLERESPEFLADWGSAKAEERSKALLSIIQEMRGTL